MLARIGRDVRETGAARVQPNGHIVNASYTGVVPDTFKSDSEVVLKGVLKEK